VAGKNIANPLAMFNASADLLEYLGLDNYSKIMRDSIYNTINVAKVHTPDMGGNNTTTDVVNYMIQEVVSRTQI